MPTRKKPRNQLSQKGPRIELRPDRAVPGARILVVGAGWRTCPVSLRLDDEIVAPVRLLRGEPRLGRIRADAKGEFVAILAIPADAKFGRHDVRATAEERKGTFDAGAYLDVIDPQKDRVDVRLDKPRERGRQFIVERFGPADRLLPGARRLAWDHLQRWKARLKARPDPDQPAPPVLPGCNWTPVGASVVANGQIAETAGTGSTGRTAPVSGRVTAIAIDPNDPDNTLYVGTAQGGVWKTTDAGNRWDPRSDFAFSLAIGAVTVDPAITDPGTGRSNRIWVGTGEANFALDSYYGGGLLRSDDGGDTWVQLGAATFAQDEISRIIVDPADSTHLYLSCSIGVFESTNTGGNWVQMRAGVANDIALDASDPASHRLYAAFQGEGILLRIGTGAWTLLTDPDVPNPAPGRVAIAMFEGNPQTLYAAFDNGAGGLEGLYRTNDGGTTWAPLTSPAGVAQAWYNLVLAVHPTDANTVYFGEIQLWRSTNGGGAWTRISWGPPAGQPGIHVDQHAFAIHPTTPATVWAGNDGGVWRSTDGGTNFTHRNRGLQTMQYYFVAHHPQWESVMLAGAQDNGAQRFGGHPAWTLSAFGDGAYAAIDPVTPTRWYEGRFALQNFAIFACFRSDTAGAPGSFVAKNTGITVADRVLFYAPLAMDPSNPSTLFMGTHRLYRTTNNADNWASITGDLTAANQAWRAISAITVAPSNSNVVYVGTSDGNFWRVEWDGATWTTTNRTAGLPGVYIADIAVHPTDEDMVYVAVSGLLFGDFAAEFGINHVWRTPDAGTTWTNISGGLSAANPVNTIVIDPAMTDRIFIGTDVGVFRSENQGGMWAPWDQGLPNVAVTDLAIHSPSRLMRAATHGRGVWERPIDAALCSAVDIYMRDDAVDVGRRIPAPSGVEHPFQPGETIYWYQSVDIKVDSPDPMTGYQTPSGTIDYIDFETIDHRNPFRGTTARVYVQVHNRGVNTATGVSVRAFWANAGGGLPDLPTDFWMAFPGADPADTSVWHPVGLAQSIPEIRPGEPEIVEWDWPVPGDAPDHTCMFAAITCTDDPVAETGLDVDAIVPGNKHITLKNLHVDGPVGPGTMRGPFFIDFAPTRREKIFDLVIRPERVPDGTRLWFITTPHRLAGGGEKGFANLRLRRSPLKESPERPDEQCGKPTQYDFSRAYFVESLKETALVRGILDDPDQHFSAAIFVNLPDSLPDNDAIRFHVQQYRNGKLSGGSVYELRIGDDRKRAPTARTTRAAKKKSAKTARKKSGQAGTKKTPRKRASE
jgi:photosystem II stability/assembly factor-like uncharacterized protein